jgi:hypothetical protein
MSAKAVDIKGIECALAFGKEVLIQTLISGKGSRWALHPSYLPVDKRAAEKFMSHPNCLPMGDGLLGGHSQSYGWRR